MWNTFCRSLSHVFSVILLLASLASIVINGEAQVAQPQNTDQPLRQDKRFTKLTLPRDRVDPAIENPEGLQLIFTDAVSASKTDSNLIRLTVEEVPVARSEEVRQLLEARGIRWSGRAASLIYDLNPSLVDIRSVSHGTTLIIPKLTGDSFLESLKAGGPIVTLSTREQQPNRIVSASQKALKDLSSLLSKIPLIHFRKPQVKTTLIRMLDSAQRSLMFLMGDKSQASQRVLLQTSLEALRLEEIVSEGLAANRVGNASIQQEAQSISEAISARSKEIKAGGSALASVEVQTLKKDGRPIPGLRIFYRPKLDEKHVDKFRSPSTPANEALALGATFILWAGEGDDPKPISDHQTIVVRRNNDPVKLIIQD
jgi:hypothetical protein